MSSDSHIRSSFIVRLKELPSRLRTEWGALKGSSPLVAVALGSAGVVGLVAILAAVAAPVAGPRTIELTARDMAYYVTGTLEPNPEIRVKAGESIRIVLRNEQAGVSHDFVVESLGVSIDPIPGEGSDSVLIRVPGERGIHQYVCTPHSLMMRGRLIVE